MLKLNLLYLEKYLRQFQGFNIKEICPIQQATIYNRNTKKKRQNAVQFCK